MALVKALEDKTLLEDKVLTDAFISAAARHHVEFLPTLARRWLTPPSPALATVVSIVAEHQARGADGPALSALLGQLADAVAHLVESTSPA